MIIYKPKMAYPARQKFEIRNAFSNYNHEKINSLFKNFDTMSFRDIVLNYKDLIK